MRFSLIAPLILLNLFLFSSVSEAGWVCHYDNSCESSGSRSSRSANPSKGDRIRINPAGVPVEKGIGLETIMYKGSFDFALIKGLGRVGAAISPSNSEETYFGPPGFELPEDYLDRRLHKKKHRGEKITLATAFQVYRNRKVGMRRFEINLGAMGKYNMETKSVHPGGGLTGVLGPFTFGYSLYNDQTQLDYGRYGLLLKPRIKYNVETISAGIFLNSLLVDYSLLRLVTEDIATVRVITASLLFKRAIFTASQRTEDSLRPSYDSTERVLESEKKKVEYFGGVQLNVTPNIMVGAFYNYYLLRELSAGLTFFF